MQALAAFTDQVKDNPNVVALLLSGSLAYGDVWEKSDIDLIMLVRDGAASVKNIELEEGGFTISLVLKEVSAFKKEMQKWRGGSSHSRYALGKIIFTNDETLEDFIEEVSHIGEDDAKRSFIAHMDFIIGAMNKSLKYITVFDNPLYSQRFLHGCAIVAADMILLKNKELPHRESVFRAAELNPQLIKEVYEIPSTKALTKEEVIKCVGVIDAFLTENIEMIKAPVIKFLSDGTAKTASQIFKAIGVDLSQLDYLADKGILIKVSEPFRVFKYSQLQLEESAYIYLEGETVPPPAREPITSKERYSKAVESFTEMVKDDPNVIAALLYGSLSYGTVWEKSDLDLELIVRDKSLKGSNRFYFINLDDIYTHVEISEITNFKRSLEKARGGTFYHSMMSKATILFTKDENLREFMDSARQLGRADAILTFISFCDGLISNLMRAEKWLNLLDDPLYAQRFIQALCPVAADMILLIENEEPTRESILRAVELAPEFMHRIYKIPYTTRMTSDEVRETINAVYDFLDSHIEWWSKPIVKFLSDGEVKTASHIKKQIRAGTLVLDYLAEKGIIERLTESVRLFKKSRLTVEEKAYVYIK